GTGSPLYATSYHQLRELYHTTTFVEKMTEIPDNNQFSIQSKYNGPCMSKLGAPLVAITDGTVAVVGIGNGCEKWQSKQLYWIPSLKLWETLYSENENQMDDYYVGASSAVTEELDPVWLERGQAEIIA